MKSNIHSRGFYALQATQFLEGLNDSAFRVVVMFIAIDQFSKIGGGESANSYVALAGATFILPFILFSTYAGHLADKVSKKTILVAAKISEILLMILGFFTLLHVHFLGLLGILFFLGVHTAFFSPAKFAILPEIMEPDELSEANGRILMVAYAASIFGQASGGYLLHLFGQDLYKVAYVFIAFAVLGFFTSLFITWVAAAGSRRKIEWNFIKEVANNTQFIYAQKPIFLATMGCVYFAFLAGIFQPNILLYARHLMGIDHFLASLLLVSISLGIGIGSFMAGRFSDRKVELGLVPLGAIGMAIFVLGVGFSHSSYLATFLILFLLGLSTGFYIVPLSALIQYESVPQERGRIIATGNFYSYSAILLASAAIYVFGKVLKLNPAQTFVLIGILTSVGTIYACRRLPYGPFRLLIWLLAHTAYHVRVINKQHAPQKGGALFIAAPMSFLNAVMLTVSFQQPIRFVVRKDIQDNRLFAFLKRIGYVLVFEGEKTTLLIQRAMANNELIFILTEQAFPSDAELERLAEAIVQPMIPVYCREERISRSAVEIVVNLGESLPATTAITEIQAKLLALEGATKGK